MSSSRPPNRRQAHCMRQRNGVLFMNYDRSQNIDQGHHNDDVIKWKHFPRYWPVVRRIHRSPLNSPHKAHWRRALMFSLICALNNRLSIQPLGRWFETTSHSSWRHCNATNNSHCCGSATAHQFAANFYTWHYNCAVVACAKICSDRSIEIWMRSTGKSDLWRAKSLLKSIQHDDVIKWKHFPRYWPFVRRIHRSPANSPHKCQ